MPLFSPQMTPLMYSCILLCCWRNMGALQQCVQSNAERHLQPQIRDHKLDFLLHPSIKNKEQLVVGNGTRRRDKGWQLWKRMKALSVSTLSPAVKTKAWTCHSITSVGISIDFIADVIIHLMSCFRKRPGSHGAHKNRHKHELRKNIWESRLHKYVSHLDLYLH